MLYCIRNFNSQPVKILPLCFQIITPLWKSRKNFAKLFCCNLPTNVLKPTKSLVVWESCQQRGRRKTWSFSNTPDWINWVQLAPRLEVELHIQIRRLLTKYLMSFEAAAWHEKVKITCDTQHDQKPEVAQTDYVSEGPFQTCLAAICSTAQHNKEILRIWKNFKSKVLFRKKQ